MKRLVVVLVVSLMLASYAWADDISSAFGQGTQTCFFTASKTSLTADGADSATLSLSVNGKDYKGAVEITENVSETVTHGVHFPMTVTSAAPGTWILMITKPTPLQGRCAPLTIQAN